MNKKTNKEKDVLSQIRISRKLKDAIKVLSVEKKMTMIEAANYVITIGIDPENE